MEIILGNKYVQGLAEDDVKNKEVQVIGMVGDFYLYRDEYQIVFARTKEEFLAVYVLITE